ncbi:MAG: Transposase domain protein [Planctomycetota bacterium]|nr:Transposase domain protein [Planctomycetota bacterium]
MHRRHGHLRLPRRGRGDLGPGKKVSGEPEDHALGRSRGGFGTEGHLICDGRGVPPAAVVAPGQRQECTPSERAPGEGRLRGRRGRPRCRPLKLAGDKAYGYSQVGLVGQWREAVSFATTGTRLIENLAIQLGLAWPRSMT